MSGYTSSTSGTISYVTLNSGQNYYIVSGGQAYDFTVLSGGYLYAQSGGTVYDTVISCANRQFVIVGGEVQLYAGGVASGTQLYGGGDQFIDSGARAYDTIIYSGGYQFVDSGTVYNTTISSGGGQTVGDNQGELTGEVASGTIVKNGGINGVLSGGTDYGTQVESGGYEAIGAGGTANGLTVQSGGIAEVDGGYANTGNYRFTSGTNEVVSGIYASGTESQTYYVSGRETVQFISSGGHITVNSGGMLYANEVQTGNELYVSIFTASGIDVSSRVNYVYGPGSAAGVTVQSGGTFVEAGGVTTNLTVNSGANIQIGGVYTISAGAITETVSVFAVRAVGDAIGSGATEVVNGGNSTEGSTIAAGATEVVQTNATVSNTNLLLGGSAIISSGGQANGEIVGGTLELEGGTANTATIQTGGVLLVDGGSLASGTQISASGTQVVSAGATAVSTTVLSGGNLVLSGGAASNTRINAGGSETIAAGLDTAAMVSGQQIVSGGSVISSQVASGGSLNLYGGAATSAIISSGATETVFSGVDSGALIAGQQIVSGGLAISAMIASGGTQTVTVSGIASGAQIASGGSAVVSSGGATSNGLILKSGTEIVFAGGSTYDPLITGGTLILSGGVEKYGSASSGGVIQVRAGGSGSKVEVDSGGTLNVSSGGVISTAIITSGGVLNISSGGITSEDDVISPGGTEKFMSGANAQGGVVSSGGMAIVSSGAVVSATLLLLGSETIASGGVAVGTTVIANTGAIFFSGANPIPAPGSYQVVVSAAGSALNLTLSGGGELVSSGGTSYATSVFAGVETVLTGGLDSGGHVGLYGALVVSGGTVLNPTLNNTGGGAGIYEVNGSVTSANVSGGTVLVAGGVFAGGTLSNTTSVIVGSSGHMNGVTIAGASANAVVTSGGVISGATLINSAALTIGSGASAVSTTISAGAGQIVVSGGTESATSVQSGGVEVIDTGVTVGGNIINGGTLAFVDFLDAGTAPLVFSGTGGLLDIDSNATTATAITGFTSGDAIVFGGFIYNSGETVSSNGDIVTVTSGGIAASLDLAGTAGAEFALTSFAVSGVVFTELVVSATSGSGGTSIFQPNTAATTGMLSGDYLWSNAGNWSDGAVPGNQSNAVESAPGVDDITALTLSELTLRSGAALNVVSGALNIGSLVAASGVTLTAEGGLTSAAVTVNVGTVSGAGAAFAVQDGGTLIVDSAPATGSTFDFAGGLGAIGFGTLAPGSYGAALEGLAPGDVLEVPGGSFSSANFGTESLTLTTNGGTFVFSDVFYTAMVISAIAQPDQNTGLEAVTLLANTLTDPTAAAGQNVAVGPGTLATNPTIAGGALELDPGAVVNGDISFTGTGGTLILEPNANGTTTIPTNTISGFTAGDTIKLAGIAFTSASANYGAPGADSYTVATAGTLTVDADGTIYDLMIAGATPGEHDFIINGDLGITEALCYLAGTRIATPSGEVPIEALSIGDAVQTLHGAPQKIKWIGKRSYDGRFIARSHLLLPVHIRAHALGRNIPVRDLFVSPGHAVFHAGILIPAWRLINGVTITQVRDIASVAYFHLEFSKHEIIFAENCPAESFYDASLRGQFQNVSDFAALYPQAERTAPVLPRIESGFQLQAAQMRLGIGDALPNSPIGPLRGYVDQAGPSHVTGWAQDQTTPETPVCLDIYAGPRRVGRVLANQYRADLRAAGLGSGCHAFVFPLPPGVDGRIEVLRASDQAQLAWTKASAA